MPTITRTFIKTSLVYFVLALLADVWLAGPVFDVATIPGLRPVQFHLLAVGWLTQLIIGVAIWMFPKYSREEPRGNETLLWATYGLLNAGLILRVAGEPLHSANPGAGWGWLLAASAVLQMGAGWLFVANAWPRVRTR